MNLQISNYKNYHWYDNFTCCFKRPGNQRDEKIGTLFFEFFQVFNLHAFSFEIRSPYYWQKHTLKLIKEGQVSKKEFFVCTFELFRGGQKAVFPCLKVSKSRGYKKFVCLGDISLEFFSTDKIKKIQLHEMAAKAGLAPKIYYSEDTTQKCWTKFAHFGDLVSFVGMSDALSNEMLKNITFQVIHIIKKLHELGIAHRDIKPDNILVDIDENHDIKLLLNDFGFSTQETTVYDRCGTSQYEAIESSYFEGVNPKIADLYSLGLTLFTLYTGKELSKLLQALHTSQLLLYGKRDNTHQVKRLKMNLSELRSDIVYLIDTHLKSYPLTLKKIVTVLLEPDPEKRGSLDDILELVV